MRLPIKRYLVLLAPYLKPQWGRVLLMAVSLLLSVGLQLFNPQLLRYFIDAAGTGSATPSLIGAAFLFVGVALANQGISVAATYLSENVAWTATNQLRTDLVAHCLSLDMAFHKTHTSGELIERIDGDVDELSNFFSEFVVHLLSNAILLVSVLVLFFLIDVHVGLLMTTFALVALLLLMALRSRGIPLWVTLRQMSATFFGFLGEQLVATEDIRANGATSYVMRHFYLLLREWLPINRKARLAAASVGITGLALFIFGSALALSLGAYLWSQGAISIGTVYLMFSYTNLLSQPIREIQRQLQDLQQAEASMQRIEELLHLQPAIHDRGGTPLSSGALSVAFQHVSFSYTAEVTVLHDLTFRIGPGKVLGILGRTGSGKTTVARLLFRLYEPQSGEICVSGIPLHMTHLRNLRQHIGMVTQDVQLFRATVRDNVTFFDRSIPDAHILEVLDDVGLSGWYHALSNGLDTELGADGEGLSAGEAQLLTFARVFLRNPGLVILDEASSRLDPATEQRVEQIVDKLFVGRMGIIIAHRLATIQRADEVLILEDGRILEYGPREALANDVTSHFYHLLQTGLEEILA